MSLVAPQSWQPHGIVDLEERAWEALRENSRSQSITASAGAGKTEFLAQKATYLLQTGICSSPRRILAISFKRDAAQNLAERVDQRCPQQQARRFDSFTFDGFTKNLLDRYRLAIPERYRPPHDYRILLPTREQRDDFLRRHGHGQMTAQALARDIARTRLPIDETDAPHVAEYWHEQYTGFQDVYLSFAMVNRLVHLLLRVNPLLRTALRATYPFVFLDEFQDTTLAQFELLRTVFEDSDSVLTAVGDRKQRIMLWAGAMPDAFAQFEEVFSACRISFLSNWRSHESLVQIQHAVSLRIDTESEYPIAQATREVDGRVCAIWEYASPEQEALGLTSWIRQQIDAGLPPHSVALLVRSKATDVEDEIVDYFAAEGVALRNVARLVGQISIQDLLSEQLSRILVPLLRLGSVDRHAESWTVSLEHLQFLEAIDRRDERAQQLLHDRLETFVRELRQRMRDDQPSRATATGFANTALDFVGTRMLRRAFRSYQRDSDYERVWTGFLQLLGDCAEATDNWTEAIDRFEGLNEVSLMTIHRSKGLEFHTMVFFGLDNETWWSLTPAKPEELNSFFVALTRAGQRAFFTFCTDRGPPVTWIEQLLAQAGVERIAGPVRD